MLLPWSAAHGMAAGGAQGLAQIWTVLLEETGLTLAQLGRKTMVDLSGTLAPDWGQTRSLDVGMPAQE